MFFWLHHEEHLKIPTSSPPPPLLHEDLLVPWQGKRPNPSTVQTVGPQLLKSIAECQTTAQARRAATAGKFWSFLKIVRRNRKRSKAFQMVHLLCLNKGRIQLLPVTPIFIYLVTKLLHYVSSILHDKVL